MLQVRELQVYYGRIQALFDVSVEAAEGSIVVVLGANGSGKSTTLRTIAGLLRPRGGRIEFRGQRIDRLVAHQIVRLGIALVPEGRELFPNMPVRDNLAAGQYTRADRSEMQEDWERVMGWFPVIGKRLTQVAGTLSGGEQQMLSIARAVLTHPDLLLLDEPSLGLAPLLVREIFRAIARMNQERRLTILLAEQNVVVALSLAQRGYVMQLGKVAAEGDRESLLRDPSVMRSYLGDAAAGRGDAC
jgi:branched-chain amino acid transport system ATP-binding protein